MAEPVLKRLSTDYFFDAEVLRNLLASGPKKVAAALDAREEFGRKFGKNSLFKFCIGSCCEIHHHLAKAKRLPGKPVKQTFYFHGDVQDVGFRDTAEIYACAAGLNCIKAENLNDGSVRVILEGPENYQKVVLSVLKEKFKVSKITRK